MYFHVSFCHKSYARNNLHDALHKKIKGLPSPQKYVNIQECNFVKNTHNKI